MTDETPIKLGSLEVSYAKIKAALEQGLAAAPSWTDLARAGTGKSLIRFVASVGELLQGGIARALQECFPDTARSPSAQIRLANLQGQRVLRARSGSVDVEVTRTDAVASSIVIPSYTQWAIEDQPFFNREAIIVPSSGSVVQVVLYRGTIERESFSSNGSPFPAFRVGTRLAWTVSNDDVWAIDANGFLWTAIQTGLWQQNSESRVFFDKTLVDGRVECKFGDGYYGAQLPAGDVTFGYAVLDPNIETLNSPIIGSTGSASGFSVVAVTKDTASPNQDAPNPSFYKKLGPGAASARDRAVTRDDHREAALKYAGVVDVVFRAQAEVNPSDIRFMNVIFVTLLTIEEWSETEWLRFKKFLELKKAIATTTFSRLDPVPVPLQIDVTVYAFAEADRTQVENNTIAAIIDYFAPQVGALGFSYAPSDLIVKIIGASTYQPAPNETRTFIDTVDVPRDPVSLKPIEYFVVTEENISVTVVLSKRSVTDSVINGIIGL